MRYISIDIETTGLDENIHQMIEFAAIIEDSNNPKSYEESKKFRRIILNYDKKYVFSSYAAKINSELISTISAIENNNRVLFENDLNLSQKAIYSHDLINDFKYWLLSNGFISNKDGEVEIVAAGKNFASFDKKFINKTSDRLGLEWHGLKFNHRTIDPTTSFIDWENDITPPSTDECKKRAEITGEVKHEALADAWDIIKLLRIQYKKNPYLSISI